MIPRWSESARDVEPSNRVSDDGSFWSATPASETAVTMPTTASTEVRIARSISARGPRPPWIAGARSGSRVTGGSVIVSSSANPKATGAASGGGLVVGAPDTAGVGIFTGGGGTTVRAWIGGGGTTVGAWIGGGGTTVGAGAGAVAFGGGEIM